MSHVTLALMLHYGFKVDFPWWLWLIVVMDDILRNYRRKTLLKS